MLPDPLRLAIALVPLAAYCLVLGILNARRRPFLTSGGADLATLGAALTGLVLIGPIELFRPEKASAEFGSYVWLFLLVFYWEGFVKYCIRNGWLVKLDLNKIRYTPSRAIELNRVVEDSDITQNLGNRVVEDIDITENLGIS